jgi:hypothetical protein
MPAIWDVINSGQQGGSDAKLLYINAPDQITPRWREFPVGFFRAVLPVSVDLGIRELQTGVRPQTQSQRASTGASRLSAQRRSARRSGRSAELSAAIAAPIRSSSPSMNHRVKSGSPSRQLAPQADDQSLLRDRTYTRRGCAANRRLTLIQTARAAEA